jgi:CubicO group peptidase (beta-lactamase class C family)
MPARWKTKDTRMFSGELQAENFRQLASIYPSRVIRRSSHPRVWPRDRAISLPETFEHSGAVHNTHDFLAAVDTTGMLVVKDGQLVFEDYWHGYDATTQAISWSVGKSFVSALMGIAIADGLIDSVEEPVTKYAPELANSAYLGVRLKDVLQMSSGARWNEDYSDPNSDLNLFGRVRTEGGSVDAYAARCQRDHPPGTFNRYNTIDTCVLGLVLRNATGRSLSDYLHDKLWEPLGMEADAFWNVDCEGAEYAGGGINAILRDYAKFGQLYLNQGVWNGVQIIPADWVRASVTPDAPHLMPGKRNTAASPFGYGYQWWVPDSSGAYSAIGIYNQFIYIDPAVRMVVAKLSAFRDFARSRRPGHSRTLEHFALFRAIAGCL